MKYHTHSNKDVIRTVRRRRLFKKILLVMCGTAFLFGLLMVIGAIGSDENNVEAYIEFKKAVCSGLFLMGISAFFSSKILRQ